MKKQTCQPTGCPGNPGTPFLRTLIKSVFVVAPVLFLTQSSVTAKHFVPGFEKNIPAKPPCGMTVAASANPSPACVGNTLSVTATVSGGTAPYSYSWTGPEPADFTATVGTATTTTPPLTINDGGFYNVTVTDATGCTASGAALVSVYSNPVLEVLATPNPVCIGNTLSLTSGFSSGGSGVVTYTWTGPNGYSASGENPSLSNSTTSGAGVYSVTVTDSHGCMGSGTTPTVSVITNSAALSVSGDVSICNGASASLSASGCTTYDWNPSTGLSPTTGSSVTASPSSTTTYVVTGHVGNCLNSANITVNVLPQYSVAVTQPAFGSIAPSTINICSGTNQTYTVTPNAGYHITAVYVDGVSMGNIPPFTLSNVSAPHTVTADFAPNCTNPTITSTTNGAVCGSGTVSLSATASAGTINWYTTSTGGTSIQTGGSYSPSVTSTTTYYVDATDGSCVSTSRTAVTATVNSNPTASASATNVLCYGANTGAVTVTGSGGTSPYTVTGDATTALAAGTYNYTLTDANGCTATTSATISQPSSAVTASNTVTNVSCYGNSTGAVTVTGSGGVGSYTVSGSATIGLAAGTYSYTVTDGNGCTATTSATVGQPSSALSASTSVTNVLCYGNSTGAVTVTSTGGTSPYTVSGAATTGLTAGSYSYTVTDANGCITTASAVVSQPSSAVTASNTVTNVNCYGNSTGAVSVTGAGGVSPYTVSGAATSNLAAGTYNYTVTDANGCTATTSASVSQPSSALSATASATNVLCYGNSTGAVTVSGTGGTSPYTVSGAATTGLAAGTYSYTVTDANGCTATASATVSQPATTLSATTSVTNVLCYGNSTGAVTVSGAGGTSPYTVSGAATTGLAAGSYSYTITDANGCTTTASASVSQPSSALSATTSVTNVLCYGNSTGAVTVTGAGGTSPYTVSGAAATGLAAGSYSYTVTDANGCTTTASASVSQPSSALSATTSVTNVLCYGNSTGAVTVSSTGGTSPYTVSGAATSNLAAGSYSYTVTDANGCTATASATVTQPATALSAFNSVTNVACYSNSTGSVVVTATGGTPNYTGTGSFTGKAAGTYSYTVTDGNGCTASTSATVSQPSAALSVTGSVTNVTCNGQSNGSVSASVTGGTTPYTYLWNTGATTSSISSEAAGTYSVTVTDAHSCTATNTFTVTQPAAVTATISGSSSVLGNTSNTYTGPSGMDSYSWSVSGSSGSISGSSTGSSVNVNATCGGTTYTVTLTVTKYGSCTSTSSMSVSVTQSTTFHVYTCQYNTGSGYHPTTTKSALACNLKVYDRHTCGTRDFSQSHYNSTYAGTSGQITNVSISGPESVVIGGGPAYRYTVTAPANGHYLILGQSTLSSSCYSGGSHTVYMGSKCGQHDSGDDDDEDEDNDTSCTSFDKYISVIKDNSGKCNEGYVQQQHGSLMLMVSPAALDYTDTVALLPVVYESVEGSWDVSATAAPPSGFYATPNDSLSTSVNDSEMNSVQFSITDTGSEWTNTQITHNIYHKGASRVAYSRPKMINDRTNKPTMLVISPNPASDEVNIVLSKFEGKATINIYTLLGQKVAEKPINIGGPTPITMDISSLPPGVYMVTAENSYGKASARLIKSSK